MAKKNSDFCWNVERKVGEVMKGEKEKRVVSLCMLEVETTEGTEERWFISIATHKFFKKKGEAEETWRPVKNYTIPTELWDDINDLVQSQFE